MIENKDLTTCIEGLRVLVVDGDSSHLLDLTKMLRACHYQVTKCTQAAKAVSLLQEGKTSFDVVITDSNLPDMNGFQFLDTINRLEIDLPVVIMSGECTIDVAVGFVIRGACEYIEKPVIMDGIRFLWKHVVRRRMIQSKSSGNQLLNNSNDASICNSRDIDSPGENNGRRSIDENGYDEEDIIDVKKPRFIWTNELQERFVAAVAEIGYHNAVPKKIMELMKVPGLTRSNVASHLQKYRTHIEKERKNLLLREKGQFHSQYFGPTDTILSNNSVSHAINEANSGILSVGFDTYNQFLQQSCSPANAEISSAALDSCIPLLDQSYNYAPTEQSPSIPDNQHMAWDNSFQEIHFSTEADQSTSSSLEVLDVTPPSVEFGGDPRSINMLGELQEITKSKDPHLPWSDVMNEFTEHDYSGENIPTASFTSNINSEYISDPSYQHGIYFDQSYGEDFLIDPYDELLF